MAVRDDEGLVFQEIRKKVLNEQPQKPHEKTCHEKSEITDHIKISFSSAFKIGLGMALGASAGIITAVILLVVLILLLSSASDLLGIDITPMAILKILT